MNCNSENSLFDVCFPSTPLSYHHIISLDWYKVYRNHLKETVNAHLTELLLMCVSDIFHLLHRPLFVFFSLSLFVLLIFLKYATRILIIEHVLNPYELKTTKKNKTIEQRHVVNCNDTGDHFVQWLISRLILVQLSTIQSQYFLSVDIFFPLPLFYCCCSCRYCCLSTIICSTVSIKLSFDAEREHHWMKSIHFSQSRTVTHFLFA